MDFKSQIMRYNNLCKIAGMADAASRVGQTLIIGGAINNAADRAGAGVDLEKDLLQAASAVSDQGMTIQEASDRARNKKYLSAAIASIAVGLAAKTNLPLKFTVPAAVVSLGLAREYRNEERSYDLLKGKKLMMNGLKDLK